MLNLSCKQQKHQQNNSKINMNHGEKNMSRFKTKKKQNFIAQINYSLSHNIFFVIRNNKNIFLRIKINFFRFSNIIYIF